MPKPCKNCASLTHSHFSCPKRARKPLRAKRPMNKRGRKTIEYEAWRDSVAKPYLDKTYGHICSHNGCEETEGLQVDHRRNRSTHPHLVMNLDNVQYLCAPHHYNKTFHIREK